MTEPPALPISCGSSSSARRSGSSCLPSCCSATAGTLRWPGAWIYLAWAAIISFGGGFWLARHDPALLNERLGSLHPARSERVGQAVHGHDAGAVVRLDRADGARCPLSLVACPALCPDHRFPPPYPRLLSRVADLQGEQLRGAGGQDPERARTSGDYRRTLRLCSPSDVCRGAADQYRRAASPRLVVGACWPAPCSPS